MKKHHITRARAIFYLVTFTAIIVVFLKFAELRRIEDILLGSNLYYLPIILAIQLVSFFVESLNYRDVLLIKGLRVRVMELFPITYVILFISQALPTAGLSGQVFFIYYLKKFGFSIAEGIGRVILELSTLYLAYAMYFVTATVLIFSTGIARSEPKIIYFIFAFLVFVLICTAIFLLSQKGRRTAWASWVLARIGRAVPMDGAVEMIADQFKQTLNIKFLRAHSRRFWQATFWQAANLFTHVLTLYIISYALGSPIPFVPCFIAFTFSKFLSMVSIVPGAPGVFEASMTLILNGFGIPVADAPAATPLTRAFTFWLPMPIRWKL